jgi:hypothetical protein
MAADCHLAFAGLESARTFLDLTTHFYIRLPRAPFIGRLLGGMTELGVSGLNSSVRRGHLRIAESVDRFERPNLITMSFGVKWLKP